MTPKKTAVEIANAIISELESQLGITVPVLAKAFLRVLAKSLGGVFVLLYQYAGFVMLQLFVKLKGAVQKTGISNALHRI